jgi:hypothetical protein
MQIPRIKPLTVGNMVNFLPLTEHMPIDNLEWVNVSQDVDDEKCD